MDRVTNTHSVGVDAAGNNQIHTDEGRLFCTFLSDEPKQCGRLAKHFLHDPAPKFILSKDGQLLNLNRKAEVLISDGIITHGTDGSLIYGTQHQNSEVQDIFQSLNSGRCLRKRLLKRQPDDDWLVMDFSNIQTSDFNEILLTVSEKTPCQTESLRAISKAFDFTVTEEIVVGHISNAFCPKEIASHMDISVNTVRAHLRSIYSKTGVRGYNGTLRLILQLLQ